MSDSNSNLSSTLLPLLISQYEKATQPGQTATSSSQSQETLKNFSSLLKIAMEEQLSSMISAFGSSDDDGDSSDSLSSLLSSQANSSSLSSLISGLGSSENSSSYASMLSSLLSSGLLTGSDSSSSSLLSSLLGDSGNASSMVSSLLANGTSNTDDLLSSSSLLSSNSYTSSAYQQLLAKLMLENYSSGTGVSSNHINQFQADILDGGDGVNNDSAPASLVMALHELGINVVGETNSTTLGQAINLARFSMASTTAKDGVDSRGNYSETEHDTSMTLDDVQRGALAAGVKTETLDPSSSDIMHFLQEGGQVVVSGTFNNKTSLPWTGDSSSDKNSAPGGAGDHIVEVSSYDSFTKLFTINDPARSSTVQVTAATLDYFMSGNAGAVGIRL